MKGLGKAGREFRGRAREKKPARKGKATAKTKRSHGRIYILQKTHLSEKVSAREQTLFSASSFITRNIPSYYAIVINISRRLKPQSRRDIFVLFVLCFRERTPRSRDFKFRARDRRYESYLPPPPPFTFSFNSRLAPSANSEKRTDRSKRGDAYSRLACLACVASCWIIS